MAEIKITDLPQATSINTDDKFVVVQFDENENIDVTKRIDYYQLNTYNTAETIVGTWIDGKPIYRQIFIGDDSNPFQQRQTLMTGVDHCIKQYGFMQSKINVGAPVEKEFTIPTYDQQNLNGYCNVYVDKQQGNNPLILNYYGNRGQTFGYIVVEYTKV